MNSPQTKCVFKLKACSLANQAIKPEQIINKNLKRFFVTYNMVDNNRIVDMNCSVLCTEISIFNYSSFYFLMIIPHLCE